MQKERSIKVVFVPASSKRPLYNSTPRFAGISSDAPVKQSPARSITFDSVHIPKTGQAWDIITSLCKVLNSPSSSSSGQPLLGRQVDPNQLLVASCSYNSSIRKVFSSDDGYMSSLDEVIVYEKDENALVSNEVLSSPLKARTTPVAYNLPVYIRQMYINSNIDHSIIALPFLIKVSSLKYEDIWEAILNELVTLLKPDVNVEDFLAALRAEVKDERAEALKKQNNSGMFSP